MNGFISSMMEEDTKTLNGALTNSTSKDFCLDLFFLAGACRKESVDNIWGCISKAYEQDRLKALKIIFWAGDIRGGAGERRFFKIALSWLNQYHPEDIAKNVQLIPEFSRWDVIVNLAVSGNEDAFNHLIRTFLNKNDPRRPLLCKWLPRKVNKKDRTEKQIFQEKIIKKIRKTLKLTPKEYRKLLVEGSNVVETKMCSKEWDKIEFEKVPSVAMNKYTKAWYRNCEEKIKEFTKNVNEGRAKINASAIFPHDIIKQTTHPYACDTKELNGAQITQWNNLPNYLGDKPNKIIPVCDVSGSMFPDAINVSIGLGLYISERNQGPFKDAFITFSERPKMEVLKGDINQRLLQLQDADWGMNTDIEGVFNKVLQQAVKHKLGQEDMPEVVLIISDMEFDEASEEKTNFEVIKDKYDKYAYKMPKLVFWNVDGRVGNVPAQTDDNVALVSGCSPSIMKSVLEADLDAFNPITIMNKIINSERYNSIY